MNPLISIIIPNYNRENLIGETLDSIVAQTYNNWECIVVDDGSTDNSKKVIQTYVDKDPRFQLHDRPKNRQKGANACRNYGFQLSKGELINWFDSDDIMLSTFIQDKLNCFKNDIDMVICTGYTTNHLLQNKKTIVLKETHFLFKDYLLGKTPVMTPSILFKKEYLSNKGLFETHITVGQETELFSRFFFQLAEGKYHILNKPLFLYRHHSGTKSRKNQAYIKKNKESQSYIQIELLKKSIQLNDNELFKVFYLNLFHSFYLGLENKHFKNAKYVLSSMFSILWKSDIKKFFKFILFDWYYLGLKRYGSRIKKNIFKKKS